MRLHVSVSQTALGVARRQFPQLCYVVDAIDGEIVEGQSVLMPAQRRMAANGAAIDTMPAEMGHIREVGRISAFGKGAHGLWPRYLY